MKEPEKRFEVPKKLLISEIITAILGFIVLLDGIFISTKIEYGHYINIIHIRIDDAIVVLTAIACIYTLIQAIKWK